MKDVDNPNIVKTQFHTALPLNGKYVIVMEVDLMSPVALIKRQFHARERLETPVEQLALYMYGVELEDDRTLFSYQFVVHKSVIGVRGAYYDFHVTTAVTAYSVPVRWHRHITVTEMLRAVWKRLAPNLDHVRFDIDGKTIPFKKCYRQSEQQLPWHATLQDLGLATRQQEHCSVCFRRARNGAALHIQFDLPSVATVQDLHESVQEWELRQRIRAATPEAQGGWMEEVLGAKDPRGPVAEGARDDQYDDDDEAVAPSGRKSVYLYTQGMPDYRHEEGMYKGEAYFSYHPPQAEEPVWIDIDMDYSVPHLSDLGVLPGSVVTLAFWSPYYEMWSSDCKLRPAADDYVAVRALNGLQVHVPVDMDEPVQDVLMRMWCATGHDPRLMQLERPDGVILPEWQSLNQLKVLPGTQLVCTRQQDNNTKHHHKDAAPH